MDTVRKIFSRAFLVAVLVCGLVFVSSVPFAVAQTGLITVIGSDTTWTKESIPYKLSAGLLIKNGATLTIEAGSKVEPGVLSDQLNLQDPSNRPRALTRPDLSGR